MTKLIIVMGVSGAGKSTLGIRLARELGWEFIEADDFHSDEARQQMQAGKPLSNEMREPWIVSMEAHLRRSTLPCVFAYSGLVAEHRSRIQACAEQARFIYLRCTPQLAAERVAQRHHHFMSSALVPSQFSTLEWPNKNSDLLILDAALDLNRLATEAIFWLSEDDFLLSESTS